MGTVPGAQSTTGYTGVHRQASGYRAGQVSQDHADHCHPSAGEAPEAGSPAERQGAGQGESTRFRSAVAEPFAGGADAQTHRTASNEGRVFGDLTPNRVRSGAGLAISCPVTDTWLQ